MFQTLHLMFETHYNELALAVDLVAERIRALGLPAPGTYKQFAQLSSIKEEDGIPKAQDMIRLLVEGHETVASAINRRAICSRSACRSHEKTAWMLRSLLEQ